MGDSKVETDWENDKVQLQVVQLQSLLNQIQNFLFDLEWSYIIHIFKKLDSKANSLSREALSLEEGVFISQGFFKGHLCKEMSFIM